MAGRGSSVCELAIGWASSGCLAPSTVPGMNRIHGGPDALLRWLESQLGLPSPEVSATVRVAQYAALLATAAGPSYAKSLATDRWATAEELLRRRDRLLLEGWDGTPGEALPALARDLAAVEGGERRIPPSNAERLRAVLHALDAGQRLPPHCVVLAEDPGVWPRTWRDVLARMTVEVTPPPVPQAPDDTALGHIQRGLVERAPVETLADESVRALVAESRLAACELVASCLAADPADLRDTVVVCEHEDAAILLDACLARHGLPTMGASRAMAGLPVLQALPLVLQLCWEPVEPQALLDLVALPVGPIPPRVGRRLAKALSEQPGLGSRAWEEAVSELTVSTADPEGKTRGILERWFEHDRAPRSGGTLPPRLVGERCGLVARWAIARASVLDDGGETEKGALDALRALAARASALSDLAQSHGGPLSEPQLARLLDAVSASGAYGTPRLEAEGGPLLVTSLAEVTRPVTRLVWLGLGTEDATPVSWTRAELRALNAAGIDLDDGTRVLSVTRDAERRGICQVAERVLAVGLPADEELRWHPLWQVLRESVRDPDDGASARPARLRRVVQGEDAPIIRPWTVPTAASTVEPAPAERPEWVVPAELLRDREASSASSLEARLACPLKWTFQYRARLRRSAAAELPSGFQLRGNFCHEVLAEVFAGPGHCPDADAALARVADLFDERLPLDATPLALPDALIVRDQLRRELLGATRVLVETLHQGGYALAGTEVALEGKIDGRTLRGHVDCLVEHPDGGAAVLDFKYGGTVKYPRMLAEGRAVQLATYAELCRQRSGDDDVRVAYLLIADGTAHTPDGSALQGSDDRARVADAPSIQRTWSALIEALHACDGWLGGETPIPARPLQEASAWPPGVELVLDPKDDDPAMCRYCDYGALCGREGLE